MTTSRFRPLLLITFIFALLGNSACFDEPPQNSGASAADSDSTSESGTGTAHETESGDSATGDGDPSTGDGDGETETETGEEDPTTGDGDGDGNPGIDPADRILFITETHFSGNMGGINGANTLCQAEAAKIPWLAGYHWLAFLTASEQDLQFSYQDNISFVLVDGTFVGTWADLRLGLDLATPVGLTQFSTVANPSDSGPYTGFWTGMTLHFGEGGGMGMDFCHDWTMTGLFSHARIGDWTSIDGGTWWNSASSACEWQQRPILCFQAP